MAAHLFELQPDPTVNRRSSRQRWDGVMYEVKHGGRNHVLQKELLQAPTNDPCIHSSPS